jgi:hypothetical protein
MTIFQASNWFIYCCVAQYCDIKDRNGATFTPFSLPRDCGIEALAKIPKRLPCAARLQKLLHRDRKIAHAHAGRVINGVGNRRRRGYRGQLAEPLGAEWARFLVELADEDDVELRDVGICRYDLA